MATRIQVGERRKALRNEIRDAYSKGLLRPGMLIPSVRELSQRHGLSKQVAHQEVQQLVEEGLLYSLPGAGTFVGSPPTRTSEFFLYVESDPSSNRTLPIGFAQRIAALGGATLVLPLDEARRRCLDGSLPAIAGVWDSSEDSPSYVLWGPEQRQIPRVGFITHLEDPIFMDAVGLDDFDGGQQATTHLLRLGHKTIGFIGLHSGTRAVPQAISWSAAREDGWRSVLTEAGLRTEGLSFHPDEEFTQSNDQFSLPQAAGTAIRRVITRPDITAVVVANDFVAFELVRTLQKTGVPVERWPAIVGFDNLPSVRGHVLSSLQRPLDLVGAAAADILWARYRGALKGENPVRKLIPMVLLPRITSEMGWPSRMQDAPDLLVGIAS